MPKTALILGILVVVCMLGDRVGWYFDGLAFSKSWFYPTVLLPITLILALGYIGALIATVVSVWRKKIRFGQLFIPAITPFLVFAIPELPLPGFTDGLRHAVNKKLERNKLIEFAEQAKLIAGAENLERGVWIPGGAYPFDAESSAEWKMLKDIYPEAFALTGQLPRFVISSDEVRVVYGGALAKHWGYTIVDDDMCPIDRLSASNCQRVYENIWVYSDIY